MSKIEKPLEVVGIWLMSGTELQITSLSFPLPLKAAQVFSLSNKLPAVPRSTASLPFVLAVRG
jgi:hypothetical protein